MKISFVDFRLYKSENRVESEELLHIPSLSFSSGHVNVIKSESGLGKTQLLNAICGQNKKYSGSILFNDGTPVYDKSFFRHKCSYVTSDDCCLSGLTIKEQFSIVCNDDGKINMVARKLKLTSMIHQKISQCSMGEKKRVEIGTAILKNSPVLLLDEPTANLDESNSTLIFKILEDYAKKHLVIVASHEKDNLLGKCCVYKIVNKEIVPVECQNQFDESSEIDTDIQPAPKIGPRICLRLGLSKSLNNKISFAFGFVFCFLFFLSTFFCVKLSTINKADSLSNAIDSLPYDYTRIKSNAEYISGDDSSFSCTQASLSDAYGSLMNVACLEDLNGRLRQEYQRFFDDFTNIDSSDGKTFYYPVIITANQQEFFKSRQLNFEVGDLIPISFDNCAYAVGHSYYHDKFIIAGIMDTHEKMVEDYSLTNSFPLIIKRDSYLSCLRHTGIRCNTINNSIKSILSEYKEYCKSNGLDCNLNDSELNLTNFIPYSTFAGLYKKYSPSETVYENDGYVYYLGNLPEKENWVMVPNDNGIINALYDLFQTSDFFSKYSAEGKIDFPLKDDFQLLNYHSLNSFSVLGLYLVNDTSLVMKDCLIVSDSLFNGLLSSIESSANNKDLVSVNITFADRSWLKENSQLILSDRSIIVRSESLIALFRTFDNMLRLRSFCIVLCIIVSILSLLFSLVHFIGIRKSFVKDFAVLTLLGVSTLQKIRILSLSIFPLILSSYVLGVFVSGVISNSLLNVIAVKSGFAGSIVTSIPLFCYVFQFLSCLLLLLLIFLLSLIGKKKTYVADIKENK